MKSLVHFDGVVPSQPAKTKVIPGHLDFSFSLLRLRIAVTFPFPPTLRSTRGELDLPGVMISDACE